MKNEGNQQLATRHEPTRKHLTPCAKLAWALFISLTAALPLQAEQPSAHECARFEEAFKVVLGASVL